MLISSPSSVASERPYCARAPSAVWRINARAAAAATSLDVLTMLGYALLTALIFVGANLIVDILYGILDPRVRLS